MATAGALLLGIVIGWFLHALNHWTWEQDAATQRRIGWNYGYGRGFNDGKRNDYRPGAPPDGRVRNY